MPPPPPSKELIAHAKRVRKSFFGDPVSFARMTVLIPAYTNLAKRAVGGLADFAIIAADDYAAKNSVGENIRVFQVVDGAGYKDGAFRGYWCPYDNGEIKSTTVWRDGDAMFTDRMDGCTFGVGSVGAGGAIRVCHVNQNQLQLAKDDTAAMEKAQHDLALDDLGPGAKLFEPVQYRRKQEVKGGMSAVTFGVRDKKRNTWSFYAQVCEGGGPSPFVLRSVKVIA